MGVAPSRQSGGARAEEQGVGPQQYHQNQQQYAHYPTPARGRQGAQHTPQQQSQGSRQRQTATVTNHANLKKPSVHVFEDDGLLRVSFNFDASAPTAVSVAFSASEEPRRSGWRLNCSPNSNTIHRHFFDKGLSNSFTLPASEAVNPESLVSYEGYSHLIVRLEAVPPESGKSLNDLPNPPGSPLPRWAQAQTTFAGLHRQPRTESEWEATVSMQKIVVDGCAYDLQEIYGIDDATGTVGGTPLSSDTATGEAENGKECVICMAEARNTTVLPCRHLCMCTECAQEMRKESNRCPICREQMTSLLTIKVSRNKRPLQQHQQQQQNQLQQDGGSNKSNTGENSATEAYSARTVEDAHSDAERASTRPRVE